MKIAAGVLVLALGATAAHAQEAPRDSKFAERAAMNRVKGASNAIVTVYEIADFECPYCGRFAREVAPRIDSAYVMSGQVKWVFMNFPLPMHANAWAASEAAMCAGYAGGQFWPMHDRIFANQNEWSSASNPAAIFARYAKDAGVDAADYQDCVANDKTASLVVRDLLSAAGIGVNGTPAFVVNNEPLFAGYKPFEEWKGILDAALKKGASK